MKRILVLGAGGFIGGHLINALSGKGNYIVGVDLKQPLYRNVPADSYVLADMRDPATANSIITPDIDQIYQLSADMGGAGFVFTGTNDADIMRNSMQINLNVVDAAIRNPKMRIFYSSSACVYPFYNQTDSASPDCREETAYPAAPESEYGWEKLFSERLYLAAAKNYGCQIRIARFHNIFGPYGTWQGGREKAVAALCRKVAEAENGSAIDVWGDGEQTRSFLYVTDCISATIALMNSEFTGPCNIGSEEMISINQLVQLIIKVSGKDIKINHIPGPVGVRGRNSDNTLVRKETGWDYVVPLSDGIEKTYNWILTQVNNAKK
jgi:GDP-D-mannose 3',5'-epimerase